MKKIVITALILSVSFFVFADGEDYGLLGSSTSVISAFKALATSNEIGGEAYINIALYQGASGSTTTIYDGVDLNISADYRNTAYTAFNWVMTGTAYKQVTLSFTFGPMTLTSDNTKYIPYSVTLTKNDTKVGNVTANSTNSTRTAFANLYFRYRDTISAPNTLNVTNASSTGTFTYNMKNSTTVYSKSSGNTTSTYNGDVCSEWTRTGQASVTLKIRNNGNNVQTTTGTTTTLGNGTYVADVVVTITAGT